MKKILVTGGFGFLGSHLVQLLIDQADTQVHVVDNLSSNPLPVEFLLQELGSVPNLTYETVDVSDFCSGRQGDRYDEIYHLASVVGPFSVIGWAGRIAHQMVGDVMAIADLALACNARLVVVSSSEIYGGGRQGLCREDFPRIVPPRASARLEYAVGKLSSEIALLNLWKAQGLKVGIVRPFNVSGPRQSGRGGFVLPRFIAQAILGADLTVFGTGEQIRAFTHVSEISDGIARVMERGLAGRGYNLGNPSNRCTILELARMVQQVSGSKSRIVKIDPSEIYGPLYEETTDKYPDSTRAIEELGWSPRIGLRQTVQDTFEYMKSLPQPVFQGLLGSPGQTRRARKLG